MDVCSYVIVFFFLFQCSTDIKFEKLEAQNSKVSEHIDVIAAQNEQIIAQNASNTDLLNLVISQNEKILKLFKND